MHKSLWIPFFFVLLLLGPAQAGTANDPEVLDPTQDARAPPGDCSTGDTRSGCTSVAQPNLDIVRGWVEPKGLSFVFNAEILDLPSLENLPKENKYRFHFTWFSPFYPSGIRIFWSANWTADGSTFEYFGGSYQACRSPICNEWTREGDRQYAYLWGNGTLRDSLKGDYVPGNPGRITWTVPMENFGESRNKLEFKGIFISTSQRVPDGYLRSVDVADANEDYVHKIYTPWWKKVLPGPSPVVVAAAALVTLGLARHVTTRRGGS